MDRKKLYKGWEEQASRELRDKNLEDHFWETPEGIKVKPLYTEDDLQKISHEEKMGMGLFSRITGNHGMVFYDLVIQGWKEGRI